MVQASAQVPYLLPFDMSKCFYWKIIQEKYWASRTWSTLTPLSGITILQDVDKLNRHFYFYFFFFLLQLNHSQQICHLLAHRIQSWLQENNTVVLLSENRAKLSHRGLCEILDSPPYPAISHRPPCISANTFPSSPAGTRLCFPLYLQTSLNLIYSALSAAAGPTFFPYTPPPF